MSRAAYAYYRAEADASRARAKAAALNPHRSAGAIFDMVQLHKDSAADWDRMADEILARVPDTLHDAPDLPVDVEQAVQS